MVFSAIRLSRRNRVGTLLNPDYLRSIIQISIKPLDLWSQEAEELLLMTAAHESRMGTYTKQINGPAVSIYQIEPTTHTGTWHNYLHFRPNLVDKIEAVCGASEPSIGQLRYNLIYSTIIARIKYRRSPGSLPASSNVWGMARYAKRFFNSPKGKATALDYYSSYMDLVIYC